MDPIDLLLRSIRNEDGKENHPKQANATTAGSAPLPSAASADFEDEQFDLAEDDFHALDEIANKSFAESPASRSSGDTGGSLPSAQPPPKAPAVSNPYRSTPPSAPPAMAPIVTAPVQRAHSSPPKPAQQQQQQQPPQQQQQRPPPVQQQQQQHYPQPQNQYSSPQMARRESHPPPRAQQAPQPQPQPHTPLRGPLSGGGGGGGSSSSAPASTGGSAETPPLKTPRRFPGPAGTLPPRPPSGELPKTPLLDSGKKSRVTTAVVARSEDDDDCFGKGAWMRMLRDLDLPPFVPVVPGQVPPLLKYNIATILRGGITEKIPNLIVMIKALEVSGDVAKVTLRDPTGQIKGTIHRRVLDSYPDLSTGAVLVLKKVSVFSPSSRSHYLNVTPDNIAHVNYADRGDQTSESSQESTPPQPKQQQQQQQQQQQRQEPFREASLHDNQPQIVEQQRQQDEQLRQQKEQLQRQQEEQRREEEKRRQQQQQLQQQQQQQQQPQQQQQQQQASQPQASSRNPYQAKPTSTPQQQQPQQQQPSKPSPVPAPPVHSIEADLDEDELDFLMGDLDEEMLMDATPDQKRPKNA